MAPDRSGDAGERVDTISQQTEKRGDAAAGPIEFFTFSWASSFVKLAWRQPLGEHDAYKILPSESDARYLSQQWDAAWARFSASPTPSSWVLNTTTRTLLALWHRHILSQFFWTAIEVGGR